MPCTVYIYCSACQLMKIMLFSSCFVGNPEVGHNQLDITLKIYDYYVVQAKWQNLVGQLNKIVGKCP